MSYHEIFRDFSVIIAAWVAIYSIDAWRREYIGRRQLEIAEEVLALFYEARDAIYYIRNTSGYFWGAQFLPQLEGESKEKRNARYQIKIFTKRYRVAQKILIKIYSIKYRFKSQFPKETLKPFDELMEIVNEINSAAKILECLWDKGPMDIENKEEANQLRADIIKNEKILWDKRFEDDPINKRINNIIEHMENNCLKIIHAKGTLYSLLNKPLTKIFKKDS